MKAAAGCATRTGRSPGNHEKERCLRSFFMSMMDGTTATQEQLPAQPAREGQVPAGIQSDAAGCGAVIDRHFDPPLLLPLQFSDAPARARQASRRVGCRASQKDGHPLGSDASFPLLRGDSVA
jgi:hypothetical protein